ncbi:hypothetical protein [Hathewaya limosa]|uniref:PBP1b-binding outer membrane lipoprotein LpoB n=1 Tax=Hathewaya limosa TaxID=1536 RepID=A0ABU0JU59_HATLI|nr:hypothetical protein [Hathewaya limosa]MDQ0479756.1 PBP1b-binding outer membrane lipoprotein LpoB [Hathewaya limosa]
MNKRIIALVLGSAVLLGGCTTTTKETNPNTEKAPKTTEQTKKEETKKEEVKKEETKKQTNESDVKSKEAIESTKKGLKKYFDFDLKEQNYDITYNKAEEVIEKATDKSLFKGAAVHIKPKAQVKEGEIKAITSRVSTENNELTMLEIERSSDMKDGKISQEEAKKATENFIKEKELVKKDEKITFKNASEINLKNRMDVTFTYGKDNEVVVGVDRLTKKVSYFEFKK